ncbi:hypothetical protein EE612_048956 [Oryza sativa]|nr:hypothetical protein EE612_048956 [Oryza sativa]
MTPVQAGAAPASPSAAAALGFLLPTCWEIEVTCAAAMILVALYAAYELLARAPRRRLGDPPPPGTTSSSCGTSTAPTSTRVARVGPRRTW